MTDRSRDAIRKAFAELTGALEDAALIASRAQGVNSIEDGCRQLRRISKALNRINQYATRLERLLG